MPATATLARTTSDRVANALEITRGRAHNLYLIHDPPKTQDRDTSVASQLIDQGVAFLASDQPRKALDAADQAISIDETLVAAYGIRADALLQEDRLAEAIEACDQALRLDRDFAIAHSIRGHVLLLEGRFAEAIEACNQATQRDDNDALAHGIRGDALLEQGRYAEAIEACSEAIRLDPRYAYAYAIRGHALLEEARIAEAEQACSQAIRLDHDCVYAYAILGNALLEEGRYAEAIESCDRAIQLFNEYAYPHAIRGEALLHLCQRIPSDHEVGLVALRDEAIKACDEALRLGSNYPRLHVARGEALLENDRFSEAVESCDHAISSAPNYGRAHGIRGIALLQLNRLKEALHAFNRAVSLGPNPEWENKLHTVIENLSLDTRDISLYTPHIMDTTTRFHRVAQAEGLSDSELREAIETWKAAKAKITRRESAPRSATPETHARTARSAQELFGVSASTPARRYHKSAGPEFSDVELADRMLLAAADATRNEMSNRVKNREVLSPEERARWKVAGRFAYHARQKRKAADC